MLVVLQVNKPQVKAVEARADEITNVVAVAEENSIIVPTVDPSKRADPVVVPVVMNRGAK